MTCDRGFGSGSGFESNKINWGILSTEAVAEASPTSLLVVRGLVLGSVSSITRRCLISRHARCTMVYGGKMY